MPTKPTLGINLVAKIYHQGATHTHSLSHTAICARPATRPQPSSPSPTSTHTEWAFIASQLRKLLEHTLNLRFPVFSEEATTQTKLCPDTYLTNYVGYQGYAMVTSHRACWGVFLQQPGQHMTQAHDIVPTQGRRGPMLASVSPALVPYHYVCGAAINTFRLSISILLN